MIGVCDFVDDYRKEKQLHYIDVICVQNHEVKFRHFSGDGITGNEMLSMFSCSKPITVTAALRLYEQGLLGLDDPVAKYLPAAEYLVYREGDQILPVKQPLTVRHLFTMTGGFDYNFTPPAVQAILAENSQANTQAVVEGYLHTPLQFSPGEEFAYSLCHDVLGAVMEVVSGKRLSEFINEEIFRPLSMDTAHYDYRPGEKLLDMYSCQQGKVDRGENYKPISPNFESGGAGLFCRVADYAKFADALACKGKAYNGYQVLKPETVELLRSEQVKNLQIQNEFTCAQGNDYSYGLGVRTRVRATDWGLEAGEFGWDGAAGSYVMIDPKQNISVFIGMHLRSWPRLVKGFHLEVVEKIYKEMGISPKSTENT